jgi:hypothetical protein
MTASGVSKFPKGMVCLALAIITVGTGWLLTVGQVGSGINWVWTLGLLMLGVGTFIISGGIDKLSIVVGPFFLVGSVLSVLRQMDQLSVDTEVPVLVILIGVLLLAAAMPFIPVPRWFVPLEREASGKDR